MGLTASSTGLAAVDRGLIIHKQSQCERIIALAGNPNVGKSTLFNALTGMNQHTGNWPGKTVSTAQGRFRTVENSCVLVDLPGTCSLLAHSAEEEIARDFICFGEPDAVIIVCDATCLERSMNLVLQTLEAAPRVLVCVNLMDEARRKHIRIDLELLSARLGVPVIGTAARSRKTLASLTSALDSLLAVPEPRRIIRLRYSPDIESSVTRLMPFVRGLRYPDPRWLCLKLLENDASLQSALAERLGSDFFTPALLSAVAHEREMLAARAVTDDRLRDELASSAIRAAEELCRGAVTYEKQGCDRLDRRLDRVLTGRLFAFPVMLSLLAFVFWLTIYGANYPSRLLSSAFFRLQALLTELFTLLHAPDWLHGALVLGVYRTLAWVISVMLPPMAIFFPLFTLLEDAGYLPRVAYNLDRPFKSCHACGKQALSMAMGFGCNAAGVVGCRIIDSPRERLLAVLTNSFVPCNGRFPALIAVITMFFAVGTGVGSSLFSALLLTCTVLLGVALTFAVTRLLSQTLLRGKASSFTLELPPYRKPQLGRVIVRSIFDRTLFVLGRSAAVAAPAGLLIWLLANICPGGISLLSRFSAILDPAARLMGLDGVILMAFILGFPANEIVIPIIIMAYTSQGSLAELGNLSALRALFVAHGWTAGTAVSMLIFSLLHWPCSTTLLTIRKETGSTGWTLVAALLPTLCGVALCMLFTAAMRILG